MAWLDAPMIGCSVSVAISLFVDDFGESADESGFPLRKEMFTNWFP
jgi:hypothetical protein